MKLRAAAAALGALLITACEAPGTASPNPSPTAAQNALGVADQKLFTGDYEGAEQAYRSLVDSGAAGAGAHYALLLDYESRFPEAIATAHADVDKHPTSANLARLTRAYDWAADIPMALDTGLKAVTTRPVDPTAHVFYAEALSDAGRFGEAESQLREAERAAGDAYFRSEIYREWANYYRDRSDAESELNNMQLSQKAQPGFPERQLELGRFYYSQKRPDLARAALDRAARTSQSAAVLQAAGDAALLVGDFDVAATYYQSSAAANSEATEPVLALAVIAVASKRDFKSAHDSLRAALQKTPADAAIYQFLSNLDRYVLKSDPAADLSGIAPAGGGAIGQARNDAIATVNSARQAAGVSPLQEDPALDVAAEEHAWYTIFNLGQQSLSGLGVHAEDASLPGFVGVSSIERDRAAGYTGTRGAEVIDHVYTAQAAVGVWLHSVYHRFPILAGESAAAGYGEVVIGPLAVSVLDLGQSTPSTAEAVVFPADGQHNVPTAFTGNEIPDPAPQGTLYPVGYPVTLEVGSGSGLAISSARMAAPDGKEVASWTLQPNKAVDGNQWCLLPQQPLRPGATYTVEVTGTVDGRAFSKRWAFTTAPAA